MPEPVILVVGSLHYDIMIDAPHLPRRDETAVGSRWYPKFGGKGGNQAVAARQQGVVTRMVGAVGYDDFARFLTGRLDAAGVDRQFVAKVSAGSGMSVAIVDAAGDYAATIVSGANLLIAPSVLKDDALWSNVAILILQNEVPDAVNIAAAIEAHRRGVRVVLNAAPTRALPDVLRSNVDILVVNAVEAQMMGTRPVTDLATALGAARTLAALFKAVIVTAGGMGLAVWAGEDQQLTLPAKKVKVISTHGAGDCFVGSLCAALARGKPLAEACADASDSAARHVSTETPPDA
jgi:ribokinase